MTDLDTPGTLVKWNEGRYDMKKELSLYEFAGVLIPSVILLFFTELLIEHAYFFKIIDFSTLGESIIFLAVAYGLGHVLHGIGNLLESLLWKIFGGMPTGWLTGEPRFKQTLFDEHDTKKIIEKIYKNFGESEGKDYGQLVYADLFAKNQTGKIDIFNANYSMFRGLTVSFTILGTLTLGLFDWRYALIPFVLMVLSLYRMFLFAKLYAKEVYRTYLIIDE